MDSSVCDWSEVTRALFATRAFIMTLAMTVLALPTWRASNRAASQRGLIQ